jgi:hypothetical protein
MVVWRPVAPRERRQYPATTSPEVCPHSIRRDLSTCRIRIYAPDAYWKSASGFTHLIASLNRKLVWDLRTCTRQQPGTDRLPDLCTGRTSLSNKMFLVILHTRSLACMPLELAELPDPNDGKGSRFSFEVAVLASNLAVWLRIYK